MLRPDGPQSLIQQSALDLLIDCLRSEVAGRPEVSSAAGEDVLRQAATTARENKVLLLLQRRLLGLGLQDMLLAEMAGTMQQNAALLREAARLAPLLAQAGIDAIFIKGPVQQRILHGTFFSRRSSDLDVVVARGDFRQARHLLVSGGYRVATPSVWWRATLGEEHLRQAGGAGLLLDLHYRISQPGVPAPRRGAPLPADLTQVETNGVAIPTLGATGALLLTTISVAKALYNREPAGAYICDIYVGLMAASPEAVNSLYALATTWGLRGHARLALRLVAEVFGDACGLERHIGGVLPEVPRDTLLRMIFAPRDPQTVWVRRRRLLWELCEQDPTRFAVELARVATSEAMRRAFERATVEAV